MRKDSVHGPTTAAGIWVTAAVGACAGAGLPVLATMCTAVYLVVAVVFPEVTRCLPRSSTAVSVLRIRNPDGCGVLRRLLQEATGRGIAIDGDPTEALDHHRFLASGADRAAENGRVIEVMLHIRGRPSVNELAAAPSELDGVEAVLANDADG